MVAVDDGWSDSSQWSHCTKNVNGIQMRTRQCVNPKPQFGGTLCTDPNATAMRGCTDISRCRQGIGQILKKKFVYYPTPYGFLMISTVHNLLTANLLTALLLIGFFTKPYWGAHRSFDATCETREGNKKKKKIIVLSCYSNVNASGVLFLQFSKQEKKFLLLGE